MENLIKLGVFVLMLPVLAVLGVVGVIFACGMFLLWLLIEGANYGS